VERLFNPLQKLLGSIVDSIFGMGKAGAGSLAGLEKLQGQWGISLSPFGSKKRNPDATKGGAFKRVKLRRL
jgi:hypothetical protein